MLFNKREMENENKVTIIRNNQNNHHNYHNHNRNHQNQNGELLGNKRDFEYYLKKSVNKTNSGNTENKVMQMVKNEGNEEIVTKKLEFKLSHILHGENTTEKADEKTKKEIREFYHEDLVDSLMYWKKPAQIGPGLNNLGNTCFLNSVLQSLLYTPALRNYLTYSGHMKQCKVKGVCFLCEMGKMIQLINSPNTKGALTPRNIIQNINQIAKHLRIGRQEDAHEFLIYILDALERSAKQYRVSHSSNFIYKSPTADVEDNLVQKLFGGKLISSVTCLKCRKTYNKVDNYLDISLHILNSENIERCFENFCKSEGLNGNNKYSCENCKSKNDAIKKFSFGKFPRVLILHLKRFDNFQRKIKKFIKYDNTINLTKFVNSQNNQNKEEYKYKLYSVLIHEGFSINSGHYYCDVKNSNDMWYTMDDSSVSRTTEKNVMTQTPYILFYERVINIKKEKEEVKVVREVPQIKENNKIVGNNNERNIFNQNTINNNLSNQKLENESQFKNKTKEDDKMVIETKEAEKIPEKVPEKVSDIIEEDNHYENNNNDDNLDENTLEIKTNFTSKNIKKIRRLLQTFKNHKYSSNNDNINILQKSTRKISPSIDNDSSETFDSSSPEHNHISPPQIVKNSLAFKTPQQTQPQTIHNRNLTHLYGSDNIELWDTEEDSDRLKQQIQFIRSVNNFKEEKIKEKDEYDVEYDTGKLKKVKLRKEKFDNGNIFQKVHDKQQKSY